MKKIIAFILLFLCSLSMSFGKESQIVMVYKARITYYTNDAKWGNKVSWQKVKKAKEGDTVAAHPKFPFGTIIHIPKLAGIIGDGKFVVQDRGSAVTKKTASKNGCYVFDVYVSSKAKINKYKTKLPEYINVVIVK